MEHTYKYYAYTCIYLNYSQNAHAYTVHTPHVLFIQSIIESLFKQLINTYTHLDPCACMYIQILHRQTIHMAFCMCSVLSNKFYKKVRTLVLGGVAGRVKLTTAPKGIGVILPLVLYVHMYT